MRICVVGPTYPYRGGIAHYTTLLVRHLREAGHWTRLYSFTRQYPRILFPGRTDKDPSLAPLQIECEYLLDPMNPITWWRLCNRIRADAPDVIILQWWVPYWTPCLTAISRWLKRHTKTHIVYICHNVVPHDGGGILDRRLATAVLRQGDTFIVHSESDRYQLQALLPDAHVVKMYHPTYAELATSAGSTTPAELRKHYGIDPELPILLFFGFVRPYKGLEYLIQAMPLVLKQRHVHLVVVGEFWTDPDFYVRYAREFGIEGAITFINSYIPNEEIRPYFDLCDVVVLPYVSATQSGVVQLAFGFGKPVITTRVGGLHEVVEHGVNGLIVPPQDEVQLAQAIEDFFQDGCGVRLTEFVQHQQGDRFSWAKLVEVIAGLPVG
ncbi:glycosyltransferase [Chloroflexia bacterium SDU3-3]|nr:glycosyltransferase [Chloroflexia bacterium SDU3-3]